MIKPTPRAAALFALSAAPAVLILALWPEAWLWALFGPGLVLALITADLTLILSPRRLSATPHLPAGLAVGRPGSVGLELSVAGQPRPVIITALLELSGETDPPAPVEGPLGAGLELPLRAIRRGQVVIEAFWLRWPGPLGLVEVRARRPVGARVEALPDLHGLSQEALFYLDRHAVPGQKSQRYLGEGAEFDRLGDFTPGLDPRFIDWKSSARHHKLLVKEFRQERNHHVVFGFDTGHLMLEPVDGRPKLDHAIRAGLVLSWVSLKQGDLVGGCAFDARWRGFLQPGCGRTWFSRVRRFTAGLDYQTEETNFTLALSNLSGRLKRRALVVLFTDFVDAVAVDLLLESLGLLTRRHLVIFAALRDPLLEGLVQAPPADFQAAAEGVIADSFLRDRALVLERAARLGVQVLDVPAAALTSALLNRYLFIKQRGLL